MYDGFEQRSCMIQVLEENYSGDHVGWAVGERQDVIWSVRRFLSR